MLLIENMTVRFGGVTALDDFSALLEPGHPGPPAAPAACVLMTA